MIITRFHNVEEMNFKIEFLSPTFLGGADQNAELRTAPFKNLLRQWWRVVNGTLTTDELRKQEGSLFGTVLGEEGACSSQVRFHLVPDETFQLSEEIRSIGKLHHPEVKVPVDRLLYLGYGPVFLGKMEGKLVPKSKRYIQPGSTVSFILFVPKQKKKMFNDILKIINDYGTMGSRSRNGYGSLSVTDENTYSDYDMSSFVYHVQDFFSQVNDKQYPHGLAKDDKGILCWEYSEKIRDWQDIFKYFSDVYMKARTQFPFKSHHVLEPRHILGYPAGTKHAVNEWGGNRGRMPSQLRLMVKRKRTGQLVGRILHLPHKLPKPWNPELGSELEIWKQVHAFLDSQKELKRLGGVQ